MKGFFEKSDEGIDDDAPVSLEVVFPTRIGAVVDDEQNRFALGAVRVDGNSDRVWASATDGRVIACVRCEGHTDQSRLVPNAMVPATKKAMGDGSTKVQYSSVWVNGAMAREDDNKEAKRFPNTEDNLPDGTGEDVIVLKINPDLLASLYAALHRDDDQAELGLTLFIRPPSRGQIVDMAVGVRGPEGIGVIMPIGYGKDRPVDEVGLYEEAYKDYRKAVRGE